MKPSAMCSDHFVLGCKICNGAAEGLVVTPMPAPILGTIVPVLGTHPIEDVKPEPPLLKSIEAQAVVTVTDEYAQACERHTEALTAVKDMVEHIEKMNDVLVNLKTTEAETFKQKDIAKRKILETLARGE